MMEELNRAGQTIVLITHDMEVAQRARRTVIIRDGVLTEQQRRDSHEDYAGPHNGGQERLIEQA
jgi:putative ABC transport system ATP-binding protein